MRELALFFFFSIKNIVACDWNTNSRASDSVINYLTMDEKN